MEESSTPRQQDNDHSEREGLLHSQIYTLPAKALKTLRGRFLNQMLFSLYGSVAFTVNQQTNPSWGTRAPRDDLERDQVLGNMHTTGTVPSKIVS